MAPWRTKQGMHLFVPRITPCYWSPPIILISAALVHGRLLTADVATSLMYRPFWPRLCTAIFSVLCRPRSRSSRASYPTHHHED